MAVQKRFYSITFIFFTYIIQIILAATSPITKEIKKTLGYPKELTNEYGYVSEEHTLVTEDGYILTVFRIKKGINCKGLTRYPPVILMHGLLQSSDSFIDSGPTSGLAYLISDACFDLWLGNVRGNYYSRRHETLDPDKDPIFWQFTVDEIGYYDIPATIDYVLKQTRAKKVNYIGFSQGAGTFFVMCSERPGYCEKANMLIALAPATRHKNTKSLVFRYVPKFINEFRDKFKAAGVNEVLQKGGILQKFLHFLCQVNTITVGICGIVIGFIDAFHPGSITINTTKTLFGHFTAGTSTLNMARYGQAMDNTDFIKFDYGKVKNLVLYGSVSPPLYNLSAVSVPVAIIYGRNDGIVDFRDVKWLAKKLPNVVEEYEVKEPKWTHLDVTYSQYTSELLFPTVYKHLKLNSIG